jgi:hypothetical protein
MGMFSGPVAAGAAVAAGSAAGAGAAAGAVDSAGLSLGWQAASAMTANTVVSETNDFACIAELLGAGRALSQTISRRVNRHYSSLFALR